MGIARLERIIKMYEQDIEDIIKGLNTLISDDINLLLKVSEFIKENCLKVRQLPKELRDYLGDRELYRIFTDISIEKLKEEYKK